MIGTVAASRLDPLLAEAELCLLAASVPNHQSTDPWTNRGTGGGALDGEVVNSATYVPAGANTTVGSAVIAGPALYSTFTPTPPSTTIGVPYSARMFDVPADVTGHELDADDTESFAITIVTTPLYDNPASVRFLWNYEDGNDKNLLNRQYGIVIENVDLVLDPVDPNDPPLNGDWLPGAASYAVVEYANPPTNTIYLALNVVGNLEELEAAIVGERQVLTVRVDRSNDLLTVWRNGEVVPDPDSYGSLDGIGRVVTAANPVKIGGGHACHGVVWHKRLLSDAEIAHLHALFI